MGGKGGEGELNVVGRRTRRVELSSLGLRPIEKARHVRRFSLCAARNSGDASVYISRRARFGTEKAA